jgi:uncharacterized phage protein (TIGR01671 family)
MIYGNNALRCLEQQNAFNEKKQDEIQYNHVGFHGFEFQQFVGLKDKAGKEIYEGDILHDCEVEHGAEYEVKFECAYYAGYDTDKKRKMFLHAFRFDECEVIGNIYETPKLLEAKPDGR